jgi:hypothetical protein
MIIAPINEKTIYLPDILLAVDMASDLLAVRRAEGKAEL